MGLDDKIKNEAQKAAGQAKERFGGATDDERIEDEGRSDRAQGERRQAGEKAKDAAEDVKDSFRR